MSSSDDSDIDDEVNAASTSCATVITRSKDTNVIDASSSWGFAAEAKKNFDIFRRPATALSERVFGNFDGVDKASLIKTTTNASNLMCTRLSAQQNANNASRMIAPIFPNTGKNSNSSNSNKNNGMVNDNRLVGGRRKSKIQSSKDNSNSDHHTKDARTGKKTEFNNFLKTKNSRKHLNAFAVCDSGDATVDTKNLFSRPKTVTAKTTTNINNTATTSTVHTTSTKTTKTTMTTAVAATTTAASTASSSSSSSMSSVSFGSNRGSNSSASISKNRSNNSHSSKICKQNTHSDTRSHSKDTNRGGGGGQAATQLNNNSNSIRNNNTNCSVTAATTATASNNLPGTPRRVALVSLPLDPNKNRYGSSSDDEIPYLTTPSTSHQSDNKYSLDFASLLTGIDPITAGHHNKFDHVGHGVRTIPDPLGMSSNYPMLSSLSPHTPPYNKNQSMGKNNHIHHKQKKNIYIYRKFVTLY